ncbi:PREDICTED: folate receptor beta-like [Nanorana parkeri]|uniref:folate receptor beta-like n=1 Tax=Nanorana parkeri TaxID=125878 RepID=UPI000854EBE6|nr:PREDICTED: folate receptor beta-like [Nanorana parkeri]
MSLRWIVLLTCISCLSAASYVDQCMDGKHHKTDPGPEDALHDQSCCTANVSEAAHEDQSYLYNFNWNHCGAMSDACKKHFIQDTCFYECSPNLGPWIQPVRRGPFMIIEVTVGGFVSCDLYTHSTRWSPPLTLLPSSAGRNKCPVGKPCRKFTEVFPSPKDLCEKIWSNSYKYTTHKRGSGRCMQLWFQGDNPNVAVAKYYADRRSSAHTPRPGLLALLVPLCAFWAW